MFALEGADSAGVRRSLLQSVQRRSHIALTLFNHLIAWGSLSTAPARKLASSLLSLAARGPLPATVRERTPHSPTPWASVPVLIWTHSFPRGSSTHLQDQAFLQNTLTVMSLGKLAPVAAPDLVQALQALAASAQ